MTRDEIMAMVPGREMDALVAEKVMMWTKDADGSYWLADTYSIRTWEQTSYPGFQSSTDIAAAWEVVEKLKERNEYISVHVLREGKYMACTLEDEAEADSPQEAICKLALTIVIKEETT